MKFRNATLQASLDIAAYITQQIGQPHAPSNALVCQAWTMLSHKIALQSMHSEFEDANWRDVIRDQRATLNLNRKFISDLIVDTEEMGEKLSAIKKGLPAKSVADMFFPESHQEEPEGSRPKG